MILNEVPEWLPNVNLVLRVATLGLLVAFLLRRHVLGRVRPSVVVLESSTLLMAVILVAGALFQAGYIDLGVWTTIGTYGSGALVGFLIVLIAWRE